MTGFAILRCDAAELHLTLVKGHNGGSHNVAHLLVGDATALHDQLAASGARIIKGLRDADHRLRGFVFADPDGNRIDVGQQLPRPPLTWRRNYAIGDQLAGRVVIGAARTASWP